jgi:hypothetical protein
VELLEPLVQVELLDHQEHLVQVELLAHPEHLVPPEHLVHLELLVLLEHLAHLELLEQAVFKVTLLVYSITLTLVSPIVD